MVNATIENDFSALLSGQESKANKVKTKILIQKIKKQNASRALK